MTTVELKAIIHSYKKALKEGAGHAIVSSERGPVGMSVIDALVQAIETQERRIAALESKAKV